MTPVLALASEIHPLVKTGGLADVVGALPPALAAYRYAVTTLIPGYPAVLRKLGQTSVAATIHDCFGGGANLRRGKIGALDLLVLDAPHLYDRPGGIYAGQNGVDWADNAIRYAALAWVAAEIGRGALTDLKPAIVHAHDWQAALAPAYLHYADGAKPKTVMTVHNLAFQGQFPAQMLSTLRLPERAMNVDGVEYYGMIGFLKAGLHFASRITTVSPRYAAEIRTGEAGMGLEGLLAGRADVLSGIVNGIDDAEWNPQIDRSLPANYTVKNLGDRVASKRALEQRFGLDRGKGPLFCVVSRLTWQKGMDLLVEALPHLVSSGGRLALLGSGDKALEQAFLAATQRFKGKVGAVLGYDEALAHLLMGGSDAILLPSRFEPCGLTQLYGLRYGCVPVVARVGGLSDTIIDANEAGLAGKAATGIQFHPVSRSMLEDAITRAIALYRNKPEWKAMQKRGMGQDLSWDKRASAYARLYDELLK